MSPCDLSYSSSLWWSLSNSLQVKIIANMTRLEEIPAYKLAKVPPKTTISSKNGGVSKSMLVNSVNREIENK